MKWLGFSALALLLLSVESVLVKRLGLEVTRIDVGLALVVYAALHASSVQGGFIAFSVGYLLDVFTGRPTGLYPFLSVLVFLLVRAAGQLVDGRLMGVFALLVGGAVFLQALLAVLFSWLTSPSGAGVVWSLSGVPLQVVLTVAAAMALRPLLRRLEPGERPDPGVLS